MTEGMQVFTDLQNASGHRARRQQHQGRIDGIPAQQQRPQRHQQNLAHNRKSELKPLMFGVWSAGKRAGQGSRADLDCGDADQIEGLVVEIEILRRKLLHARRHTASVHSTMKRGGTHPESGSQLTKASHQCQRGEEQRAAATRLTRTG